MTAPGIGDITPRSTETAEVVSDLLTLLGNRPDVDVARATLVVELAMLRVRTVISPIPEGARPIILEAARRAFSNPDNVAQESAGPFTRSFREPTVYLTQQERDDLEAMRANRLPGAFTIRPGAGTA